MPQMAIGGSILTLRIIQGFLFGLIFGVFLTSAGSTLWADEDAGRTFKKSVLYALAQLAVDTEKNGSYIVELRQRVNDLEIGLEEISQRKN